MSEKHDQLKNLAIDWLREHDYNDIEMEVKVLSPPTPRSPSHKGKYSIDIVGRNGNKKIAIECGGSKPIKLNNLLGLFNEVWVFPYGDTMPLQWREGMNICQNCGHTI